jgi:CPA1 family monovalent cation:H+ antiporter
VELFSWFATSALIAVGVAVFTRQRGWGMALPVLVAGAICGFLPFAPSAPPDPQIVLAVILAPLVFGEALGSSFLDLRRVRKPVLTLAIGLVLATTLLVGGALSLMITAPLALLFALGAVLAPTDAVAVSSVAKRASLNRRLVSILEGESLVNDGTGLTLLRVAVIALLAGSVTLVQVTGVLALSVLGGVAVGVAGGWLVSRISLRTTDTVASNGLIIIAPFVLYLAAERIEGSGILAVVIAALWIAHAQSSDTGHAARLQGVQVWKQLTFLLQAMAFFLVGLELTDTLMKLGPDEWLLIGMISLVVVVLLIVIRFGFIYAMVAVIHLRGRGVHEVGLMRGATVIAWAGARGPVSGLAAFSIPLAMDDGSAIPYREALLCVTFVVILVTLVLAQTLGPLARKLQVTSADDGGAMRRVNIELIRAALERLDDEATQAELRGTPLSPQAVSKIRLEFELSLEHLLAHVDHDENHERGLESESDHDHALHAMRQLEFSMLRAEEEELVRIRDDEGLPDPIFRELLHQIDLRREALRNSR